MNASLRALPTWIRAAATWAALAFSYALTGAAARVGTWTDVLVVAPAAAVILTDLTRQDPTP